MSQANFESYLAGPSATSFDEDELTVAVANPLVRETLEQRFRPHIMRALYDIVGRPCQVRLTSGGKLHGHTSSDAEAYGMFGLGERGEPQQPAGRSSNRRGVR